MLPPQSSTLYLGLPKPWNHSHWHLKSHATLKNSGSAAFQGASSCRVLLRSSGSLEVRAAFRPVDLMPERAQRAQKDELTGDFCSFLIAFPAWGILIRCLWVVSHVITSSELELLASSSLCHPWNISHLEKIIAAWLSKGNSFSSGIKLEADIWAVKLFFF